MSGLLPSGARRLNRPSRNRWPPCCLVRRQTSAPHCSNASSRAFILCGKSSAAGRSPLLTQPRFLGGLRLCSRSWSSQIHTLSRVGSRHGLLRRKASHDEKFLRRLVAFISTSIRREPPFRHTVCVLFFTVCRRGDLFWNFIT